MNDGARPQHAAGRRIRTRAVGAAAARSTKVGGVLLDPRRARRWAAFVKSWPRGGRLAASFRTIQVSPRTYGRFQYILGLR